MQNQKENLEKETRSAFQIFCNGFASFFGYNKGKEKQRSHEIKALIQENITDIKDLLNSLREESHCNLDFIAEHEVRMAEIARMDDKSESLVDVNDWQKRVTKNGR